METILNIPVEEHRSATRYNDISTVIAWLPAEETRINCEGREYKAKNDHFSCFSKHYEVRKEREFIAELIAANPDKYARFVIHWCDAN